MTDLAQLLAHVPGGGVGGLGLASGVMETFDVVTGANTVRVGDALLSNVPVLNSAATVQLLPGDVVQLLESQAGYVIIGRVAVPNSSEFTGSTYVFHGSQDTNGFPVNLGRSTIMQDELFGTHWVTIGIVHVVAHVFALNQSGTDDYLEVRTTIEGDAGQSLMWGHAHNNAGACVSTSHTAFIASPHLLGTGPRRDFQLEPIQVGVDINTQQGGWNPGTSGRAVMSSVVTYFPLRV